MVVLGAGEQGGEVVCAVAAARGDQEFDALEQGAERRVTVGVVARVEDLRRFVEADDEADRRCGWKDRACGDCLIGVEAAIEEE